MGHHINRIRAAPTENLWVKTKLALPNAVTAGQKTRNSTCPKGCTNISGKGSENAASSCATPGSQELLSIASNTRKKRKNYSACSTVSFRNIGTATCLSFLPTRKAWQLENLPGKC